jgi:hypothetical protein
MLMGALRVGCNDGSLHYAVTPLTLLIEIMRTSENVERSSSVRSCQVDDLCDIASSSNYVSNEAGVSSNTPEISCMTITYFSIPSSVITREPSRGQYVINDDYSCSGEF